MAQKFDNPVKTYNEIRAEVENALSAEEPDLDSHPRRNWYIAGFDV